ncbi:hypothetical protein [Spirillospora sp. CA-294931]|uniref:hypothetical protein n=1 Tax=Spirillospora sp. CA-294931 TaxID=3240042 RepID=UPI003D8ABF8D
MPKCMIKPEPGRDLYVEWSTVVEAPVAHGTRAEWEAEGVDPAHLDRADRTGTSCYPPLSLGAWDDDELLVAEPLGRQRLLPRDHLTAYTTALHRRRVHEAYGMTRPIGAIPEPPEPKTRRRAVRVHRRRCRLCSPGGQPGPLKAAKVAYARRRKARRRRR